MWHDKCLNESVCEVKRVCRALEPVCFSEEVTIIPKVCRLPAFMYSSSVTTQLDVMSYWATKRLNNSSNVSQLAGDSSCFELRLHVLALSGRLPVLQGAVLEIAIGLVIKWKGNQGLRAFLFACVNSTAYRWYFHLLTWQRKFFSNSG